MIKLDAELGGDVAVGGPHGLLATGMRRGQPKIMEEIVYKVVGSRGRWFIEHSGGRYGPFVTKREAVKIARAARKEGEVRGIEVTVKAIELPSDDDGR